VGDTPIPDSPARQALLDECHTIDENCSYTAQAHFEACADAERMTKTLTIAPSIVGALIGAAVAVGAPTWLGILGAVAGVTSGLASGLGVDKRGTAHKSAANLLTGLRHDARALRETFAAHMADEVLLAEVRRLHDRYGVLIQASEITDNKYFERARQRIQAGRLEPDFRQRSQPALPGTADTPTGAPTLPSGPPKGPDDSSGSR
jgi:hypothetical protein